MDGSKKKSAHDYPTLKIRFKILTNTVPFFLAEPKHNISKTTKAPHLTSNPSLSNWQFCKNTQCQKMPKRWGMIYFKIGANRMYFRLATILSCVRVSCCVVGYGRRRRRHPWVKTTIKTIKTLSTTKHTHKNCQYVCNKGLTLEKGKW